MKNHEELNRELTSKPFWGVADLLVPEFNLNCSRNFCNAFSSFQRVLSSPEAFRRIEEDFDNLQETKSKVKSPQEEEQFEAIMQKLRSSWEDVQGKIKEMHPKVQVMADAYSEYKENLRLLTDWVDKVEEACEALECVEDYSEFQPLMEKFQVSLSLMVERNEMSK